MKKVYLSIVLLFTVSVLTYAQTNTKVNTPLNWYTNIFEAQKISNETKKPIFAFFTGSDWCGWCKRLTASVFSKPEFTEWAKKNVVLLELDFPRRTKLPTEIQQQNYSLQNSFQVSGYPTVWVFNVNKDEKTNQFSIEALGKTGYTPTVEQFVSDVEAMIKK